MTITLENVNNNIFEVIKSLVKLDSNIVLKKDGYKKEFIDDINKCDDEFKSGNLKTYDNFDEILKDIEND